MLQRKINSLSKRLLIVILILTQATTAYPLVDEHTSSAYDLVDEPDKKRDDISPPLFSFFLPGADQWWEKQYGYASVYSGVGFGSLGLAIAHLNRRSDEEGLLTRHDETRFYQWAAQTYSTAGAMSMYHSFRSAVRTRQPEKYTFLTVEESPTELALSAFRFDYLIRPTTFIPLLVLGTTLFIMSRSPDVRWDGLRGKDALFAGAFSYNAGLWEELVFRGFLTQAAQERIRHPLTVHMGVSALFAAAHITQGNKFPLIQFLGGLYFGWLSERNNWTLSEGIFIHTWWDVIAFSAAYAFEDESVFIPLPGISLVF